MTLIRGAIRQPIAVLAILIMLMLFGGLALNSIPIQMAPDIERPVITVTTSWGGAAPAEVEREILVRQEDVLKGLPGLRNLTGRAVNGSASVSLEFALETDLDRALLTVANRLDRVQGYPDEADEPQIQLASAEDSPIARFVLKAAPGRDVRVSSFGPLLEDVVAERLERVPGVGLIEVVGAEEEELRVEIRPEDLAAWRLTVPDVIQALRAADVALSGGSVDEGKRRYTVRLEGGLSTPEAIAEVLLRTGQDERSGRVARVTVGDVARIGFAPKRQQAVIRHNGEPAVLINILREPGANVLETMEGVKTEIDRLAAGALDRAGLVVINTYDETIYIRAAIGLVTDNLVTGICLSALVLLLFLRSVRATLTVCVTIPISLVGTFVGMAALGLSLNVISLAGLAFAVGNVVDAAIVVVETIYRRRREGESLLQASIRGTELVWRAVLVSTLATVLVFAPLLLNNQEVGQLFRDIAVAYCIAVGLSLMIAITVVPLMASRLFGSINPDAEPPRLPVLDPLGFGFEALLRRYAAWIMGNRPAALMVVLALTLGASATTWLFLPKLEYLPEGNRNFIIGQVTPPPGFNLETTTAIGAQVEAAIRPLWEAAARGEPTAEDGRPAVDSFFFFSRGPGLFFGASAKDETQVRDLARVMRPLVLSEPGAFGFVRQPSLFGRGIGGTRSIELDIGGQDLEQILAIGSQAALKVAEAFPARDGNQFRPRPGLEMGAPELRLEPDRTRLADAGLTVQALGQTVDAMNDGLRVAEITAKSRRMDLTLAGPEGMVQATQGIAELPVVTRNGTLVPAGNLARASLTAGPVEILRKERRRTVTLEIIPSPAIPLEEALERVTTQVVQPLEQAGLPDGVTLRLSGTADRLAETWGRLSRDLMIAMIIVFLTIAVMFGSVAYPVVILFTVPLATAGAFLGLELLRLTVGQGLDMLTMMGFVILIGMVVNNAILIVDQSLIHYREDGMSLGASVAEATGNRIRPIFMSSLANIIGLMPMVLSPGAGSELYRGLSMVVLGGLTLSALLTLAVTPALLSLVMPVLEAPHPVEPELEPELQAKAAEAREAYVPLPRAAE